MFLDEKISFKEGVDCKEVFILEPALFLILTNVMLYCRMHSLPCVITSLVSGREGIEETSHTHEEGRAFDLRSEGISDVHIQRIVFHVNQSFEKIGAISKETGKSVAAYAKPHGTGPHIHFQVRPNAPFWEFVGFSD